MATKDISRSSLEGGRYGYNKWERRYSNRVERNKVKVYLDRVTEDEEYWYDTIEPERKYVEKGFTDKLRPAYRWLASNCGRPWSEVYSELTQRFDTRSLSSWHIVVQHMLSDVEGAHTESDGRLYRYSIEPRPSQRFFIDDNDILRDRGRYYYSHKKKVDRTGPTVQEVSNRMGRKKVFEYEDGTFRWALPDKKDWCACRYGYKTNRCPVKEHGVYVEPASAWLITRYAELQEPIPDCMLNRVYVHYDYTEYKAGGKFSEDTLLWWNTLSPNVKRRFLIDSSVKPT